MGIDQVFSLPGYRYTEPMETLWEAVKRFGISAFNDTQKGIFTIPDGHALIAADQIHRMLPWIESEFQEDCANNPDILQAGAEGQRDFLVRNISRTLSYVNQTCLLEGILKRSYELMIASLQVIDATVVPDTTKLQQREAEIEEIKRFRNKVAAHTAFADPRPDDNPAQELTSLLSLVSTAHDGPSNTLRLGAVAIHVGGDAPQHKPEASINEMHPIVMEHFRQWIIMFEEVSTPVRAQLPKTVGDNRYEAR